ncbi:MAG TPA: hypothetical protein VEQ37_10045 [Actinomycetota bacterium]|nr:hypothetical protein [Actinomycetota bacterium]
MRQDQHHLDVPVLLEVGHALDEAGKDSPTEFVRAVEQGRAELGSYFPEPADGSELDLFIGLPGDLGQLLAQALLSLGKPVDGLPDEDWIDPVAEPIQFGELLFMEVREPALQPGASFQARLLPVSEGRAQLPLERGRAQRVEQLGAHHVNDEFHEPVVAEPGAALLALPQDDNLPALAKALRRAHPVAAAENEPLQRPASEQGAARPASPVPLRCPSHAPSPLPNLPRNEGFVGGLLGPHPLRRGVGAVAARLPASAVPDLVPRVLGVVQEARDHPGAPGAAAG